MQHTAVKPFPCDQCDKSFARKWVMLNHKKTFHMGDECRYTILIRADRFITQANSFSFCNMVHSNLVTFINAHKCKIQISPFSNRTYLNILNMMKSPEKDDSSGPHAHLSSAMRSRAKEVMKAS